jgi:hypothetical protein
MINGKKEELSEIKDKLIKNRRMKLKIYPSSHLF